MVLFELYNLPILLLLKSDRADLERSCVKAMSARPITKDAPAGMPGHVHHACRANCWRRSCCDSCCKRQGRRRRDCWRNALSSPISGHPTKQGKRTGLHISGRNLLQCYQDCVGASKVVCESAIEFPAHRELKQFSTVSLGLLSVQCLLLRLHERRYANSIDRCVHHDGNDGHLVVMELIWTHNHLGSSWFLLFGSAAAQE